MNRKKRALSLGLAAAQLASLAPLCSQVAFADADTDAVGNAKTAATNALNDLTATNTTTAADVLKAVTDAITATGVSAAWDGSNGFNLTEATTLAAGSITGTINLTLNSESDTISVNLTIEKLPAEKTDADKVSEAKTAAEAALADFKASNTTDADAVLTAVNTAIASTGVSAAWDGSNGFNLTEATTSAAGSITDTINLTLNSESDTINVNLTIEKLPAEKTDADKVSEAKTTAEAALADFKASNTTDADAVLTAVNTAIASTGVSAAWDGSNGFNLTEATTSAAGSITGTINLTMNSESDTISVNLMIEKLPAEKTDAEKLADAKKEAEDALKSFIATNSTDAAAVMTTVTTAITNKDVTADWAASGAFNKTEADNKTEGTIIGTITLTLGKETADVAVSLTIARLPAVDISTATVTVDAGANLTYTSKEITPAVTVVLGADTLVKDTDYTVAYTNNINAGSATVTITGTGDYKGTKAATFDIAKADQTLAAPTATYDAETKKITVSAPVDGAKYLCNTSDTAPSAADLDASAVTEFSIAADGTYYVWAYLPGDANHNASEIVKSAAIVVSTTVADKPQTAPAAPTMKSRTNTSITLNAIAANANGAAAEYSKDGKTWQDSATFSGLTKNTEYTFYARYKAVTGFTASPASDAAKIKTDNTSSGGTSSGGSSSGGSSHHTSSGGSSYRPSSGSSTSSGERPADSSSKTTPNITNDTADDIKDVIDTKPNAANLSKITDSAEDVQKALKEISKPSVIEKQAADVLESAIRAAKLSATTEAKEAAAENIQLIMKALSTKAPKVLGDADNSGKVDSDDVLLSVLNFRKYRTNAAGQLYSAVVMGVTNKTTIDTNDILAFIKAFRTR